MTTRTSHMQGRLGLFLATLGGVLVLDQVTKIWAVERLADGDIDLVWRLRFHLAFNPGASFSLGQSWGPIFGALAALVAVILFVMAMRQRSTMVVAAMGVVTGGVLGNLIDRAVRADDGALSGKVVDFIELERLWPVFNIADSGIVCGVIVLMVASLRGDLDVPESATPPPLLHRGVAPASDALLDRFDADSFSSSDRA